MKDTGSGLRRDDGGEIGVRLTLYRRPSAGWGPVSCIANEKISP